MSARARHVYPTSESSCRQYVFDLFTKTLSTRRDQIFCCFFSVGFCQRHKKKKQKGLEIIVKNFSLTQTRHFCPNDEKVSLKTLLCYIYQKFCLSHKSESISTPINRKLLFLFCFINIAIVYRVAKKRLQSPLAANTVIM